MDFTMFTSNRTKTIPDPVADASISEPIKHVDQIAEVPSSGEGAKSGSALPPLPFMVSQGYHMVSGRRGEDRVVCGTKILEKNGIFVELSIVIDGHGGAQVAEFLSEELPKCIQNLCIQRSASLNMDFRPKTPWADILKEAFEKCNSAWDAAAQSYVDKRAGAVATALLMCGRHGFIAHVGDGKVVVSSGESYRTLTSDHRAHDAEERRRIESCGGHVCNNRVRGVLAPSRAFGDILVRLNADGTVNNELIRPDPELVTFDMKRPSFLVLGTDGLFDVISDSSVATATSVFMASQADPISAAKYLAEHAAKITEDDVSVVVIMWR